MIKKGSRKSRRIVTASEICFVGSRLSRLCGELHLNHRGEFNHLYTTARAYKRKLYLLNRKCTHGFLCLTQPLKSRRQEKFLRHKNKGNQSCMQPMKQHRHSAFDLEKKNENSDNTSLWITGLLLSTVGIAPETAIVTRPLLLHAQHCYMGLNASTKYQPHT